jgi:hypothetical protein
MDSHIEAFFNSVFNFCFIKAPLYLAPYFLHLYAISLNYYERIQKQSCKTFYAIQNSFRDEFLGFIQVANSQYFPFLMTRNTKYTRDPCWIYNQHEKLFTYSELGVHSSNHNLPFIGASLTLGDQTIGDLSDWIMDQKVHGPDAAIPLQVMVGAWRYYFDKTYMYSFKNYKLIAITDDGEEHVYNLENEEETCKKESNIVCKNLEIEKECQNTTEKKTD